MTEYTAPLAENAEPQFMMQRIYAKGMSFETPNSPKVFQQAWEPDLTVDLNTAHTLLEPGVYEVVLTVTATVKNKETTAFLIEVEQAGIFSITGVEEPQLAHLLGSFCPNLLFPYAREAITSQVTRGSFPQLVLAPINFDAVFAQQQQAQQKAVEEVH